MIEIRGFKILGIPLFYFLFTKAIIAKIIAATAIDNPSIAKS